MPQPPYSGGVADTAPQVNTPDDYQHIQSSPLAFGGGVAEGLGAVGQGASKAGEFFGQVQTDDAVNNAMTNVNKTLDTYRSLRGADALNAQEGTRQQIDDTFKQARDGLSTPAQQAQFDGIVRSYQQRYVNGIIASHADQQQHEFATKTNQDSMTVAMQGVANVADDDAHVQIFRDDARKAAVQQTQLDGMGSDPKAIDAAITRADQAVYKTQIETIAVKDPARAAALADQHKDVLGQYYAPIAEGLRTRASEQRGTAAGDQAMARATGAVAPVAGSYVDKVTGVEGTKPNPDSTANGTGQFINSTWINMVGQYRPDLAAGKTPEQILELRKDPAIGREMVANYARQNGQELQAAGIPVTDSNLYVAHFLGGDGATKVLSAPDSAPIASVVSPAAIQANPAVFKQVQTVGELKTWADAKMGGPIAAKADAYGQIMDDPNLSQQDKQYAIQHINQQYQRAQIASQQNAQATKAASDAAEGQFVKSILLDPTKVNAADIANDPNLSPQSKITMSDLLEKHMKAMGGGDLGTYGPGFYDVFKAVTAPQGDPTRVTNQSEVLRLAAQPNSPITLAGAEKLVQIMKQSQAPEGAATTKTMDSVLAYAKQKLSFEQDYGSFQVKDPKGMSDFNIKFVPAFMDYWQKGLAAGKTPLELSDPKNIDAMIEPLKRSAAQLQADRIQSGAEGAAAQQSYTLPQGIPPGSQFSPSRNQWRDPSGKLFDANGKPLNG